MGATSGSGSRRRLWSTTTATFRRRLAGRVLSPYYWTPRGRGVKAACDPSTVSVRVRFSSPALGSVFRKQGSDGTPPSSGPPSVAVGADHLALLDLLEHALPVPVSDAGTDVEPLVAEMVEVEHYRVGLSAVGARMGSEVLDQVDRARSRDALLVRSCPIDVPLPVGRVVLLAIRRSAVAAERVPLNLPPAPPREIIGRLGLAAARAPQVIFSIGHERMFARDPDRPSGLPDHPEGA